jgi:hypothetical protein
MRRYAVLAILLVVFVAPAATPQQRSREHWVATWAAAPHTSAFVLPGTQPLRNVENP